MTRAGPGRGPGRNSGGDAERGRLSKAELTALWAAGLVRVVIGVAGAAVAVAGAVAGTGPSLGSSSSSPPSGSPWSVYLVGTMGPLGGRGRHQERPGPARLAVYGGPLGDVLVVFAAQCLVPWGWGIFLLADALAISLAAWIPAPRPCPWCCAR